MALSYPLSLANFFDWIPSVQASFRLGEAVLTNVSGGGEQIRSDYGTRLWRGNLVGFAHAGINLDETIARVELLLSADASFLVTQSTRRGPQGDPNGTLLGAATPQITSFSVNNLDVTLGGLPVGYKLMAGDLLSFTYLSSPLRYALHRVVTPATANGSGVASTQLVPPVRPGRATPSSITLVRPVCKAQVVAGSYREPVMTPNGLARFSFDWEQTLR